MNTMNAPHIIKNTTHRYYVILCKTYTVTESKSYEIGKFIFIIMMLQDFWIICSNTIISIDSYLS